MRAAFRNGNLYRSGHFALADFEVTAGRISSITPAGTAPSKPTGGEPLALDLEGAYVLPGLIDAHAHLTLSQDAHRNEPLTARVIKGVRNAGDHLRAGVTSVRDVGGPGRIAVELKEAVAAGIVAGPRVHTSASFICATGGHVNYWGREADGTDDVRRAVREQRKAGADFIKIMASGGVADVNEDPEVTQYTLTELESIVDAANEAGTYVAAHAHPATAISLCLQAGVRTIEHASFIDERGIELALERGAYLVPTFLVYDVMARSEGLSQAQRDMAAKVLERKAASFLAAVEAGVKWGVGTDSGSYLQPGQLWQELLLLHDLGIPMSDVLHAATVTNAEILRDDAVGRLEPGCWADAIVLDQDPTIDPGALARPALVIQGGRVAEGPARPPTPTQAVLQGGRK